ncbi:hypothetical protein EYF80_034772 [Liparis tanakae]
MWPNR